MADASRKKQKTTAISDDDAVKHFSSLIRFKTMSDLGHLDGSNVNCVAFLASLLEQLGLTTHTLEGPAPGPKPVLVAEWKGTSPDLPCVLLNSHYDVVPVMEEHWTQEPFGGEVVEEDGEQRLYGRGTQDMKIVCMQYIVAISRMVADGVTPARSVYLTFVPDEETGGDGMAYFLASKYYKENLQGKIGCALDEGLANTEDAYTVFYGERSPWWVLVDANGPTGHGSRFITGTATHCLHSFSARALKFRKEQEKVLWSTAPSADGGCGHAKCKKLGDVTTINLTMQKAGVSSNGGETYAINVIPTKAEAGFDVRVSPTVAHQTMCDLFTQWCREAEEEWGAKEGTLSWRFAPYGGEALLKHHMTSIDPAKNPYWGTFKSALEEACGTTVIPEVFPAGTDSRFLRALDIPCFGFSPMKQCPILLHEHNEYVPVKTFLDGCDVYRTVVARLVAMPACPLAT